MCMFFLVYWPLQKQDGHYQPIKILRTLKASFSRRKRLDELKVDYYKTGGYISGKWTQNDIKEEFSDRRLMLLLRYMQTEELLPVFYTSGKNF